MGVGTLIVLDTHAWVWWVAGSPELSARGRTLIEASVADRAVHVSSISAWEVALLVAKGRLKLSMDPADWIARSEALPFVTFVPVDNRIAIRSVQLPPPLHDDPADRIIIATALVLGAVLVTQDERIRRYPHVTTRW